MSRKAESKIGGDAMFGWFKVKSPLTEDQASWIEEKFQWLRKEFGEQRLEERVITPTDEFFPERYSGTQEDASALFERVCEYMGVECARVHLNFYTSPAADDVAAAFNPIPHRDYALGAFQEVDGHIDIWLEVSRLNEPGSVVATFAHELGHVHLLADRHYDAGKEDHEPLTDLFVVYSGMGVFIANNAIREANWSVGRFSGWSASRQGYLSFPELAYALALYAHARKERKPAWASHLRKDVRVLFDVELKDLLSGRQRGRTESMGSAQRDAGSDNDFAGSNAQIGDDLGSIPMDSLEEFNGWMQADEAPTLGSADELFEQGISHAAFGEHGSAIEAYPQSLAQNPNDAEAWLHRGKSHYAVGNFSDAIRDCTESLRIEPNDLSAECCRASARLWLRQFSEAMCDLDNALRCTENDANPWLLRGIAHNGLNEYQQAIEDLKHAIRYAPTWADSYLARSLAYEAMGDAARAQTDLNEAIRRDPTLADEAQRSFRLAGRH
jgi:tetratricopeptide (TPR) repeat protein